MQPNNMPLDWLKRIFSLNKKNYYILILSDYKKLRLKAKKCVIIIFLKKKRLKIICLDKK